MITILIQFFLFLITLCDCQIRVKTKHGPIQGRTKHFEDGDVIEFLGVPFGRLKHKHKRFMPPSELRIPEWKKTFYAKRKAVSCYQHIVVTHFSGLDELNPTNKIKEDCLQLNMWVPKNKSGAVIVVTYAGSFTRGSPSLDLYNGSVLALKTRAIVVNINYRLGVFGFAYLGENSKIKGNMGFLDQQLGMKWVYENIENFGGKKNMITLFGESAGGASVTAHFLAPDSMKYFSKAIVISATISNIWATVSPNVAKQNTEILAKLLKCEGDDDQKVRCLQRTNVKKLLKASVTLRNDKLSTSSDAFIPIDTDSVFFKGSLAQKLKKMDIKKDLDLLFGRTSHEGTYFMIKHLRKYFCSFDPKKHPESLDNNCEIKDTVLQGVVQIASNLIGFNKEESSKLFMIYNSTKTKKPREKVAKLLSDLMFNCKTSSFVDDYFNLTQKDVYFFEFQRRSSISPWPEWMGAVHGRELEYFFGYPFRHPYKYDRRDIKFEKKFSEKIMKDVGEFALNGRPLTDWKKFTKDKKRALVIDDYFCDKNYKKYKPAISEKCVKFWQLLHQLKERLKQEYIKKMMEMKKNNGNSKK